MSLAIAGNNNNNNNYNNETDRFALLDFKKQIYDPYGALSSWNDAIHFCNWVGITCGHHHRQRVIGLYLRGKGLGGNISPSIGNLSFLHSLDIANNSFHGKIPHEIGNLIRLQFIVLPNNTLEGELPTSLANCTRLRQIDFSYNKLVGKIPGEIPASLGNISSIQIISLNWNTLHGNIPKSFGQLTNLYSLGLSINNLSGMVPFSLYNLSSLEIISLAINQLHGSFPRDIGLTLPNLKRLAIGENLFSGRIPNSFSNISKLEVLSITDNSFVGPVPNNLGNLQNLQWLFIGENQFGTGEADNDLDFVDYLVNCTNLKILDANTNGFKGPLPNIKANLSTQLSMLLLGQNQIFGTIPLGIENLSNLTMLALEENFLEGNIPFVIGKLLKLQRLFFGGNRLSGQIPSAIGNLTLLYELHLEENNLNGSIPSSIGNCHQLQFLTLLSAEIPSSIGDCNSLEHLYMGGEVPTKGIFGNASAIFVNGNDKLCGGVAELHLLACTDHGSMKREKSHAFRIVLAIIGVLSYRDLFQATGGFSSANFIGSGSFDSVYKGIIDQDETIVAVKVLNLQNPRVYKSFIADCEALRNIRHRNLVKILTSCSSIDSKRKDFKALVYEFMPNRSLDDWLHLPVEAHNHSRNLNLLQRLNIAIDVASDLNYLHYNCHAPIGHCDLKPSNVLLDIDMIAHVSDFGLARLLLEPDDNSSETQTSTIGIKGSIGYATPEYGMGGRATIHGDVFSYGILLLEIFTGKRPTDQMFTDDLNLHNFAKAALPAHVMQILDPTFLSREKQTEEIEEVVTNRMEGPSHRTDQLQDCITSIIEIAVQCSMESPRERMRMNDVVRRLHLIKGKFS
ncbi:LRR receptor-like serine/threonine-protein kinase EFR [Telopea speciosissima]|uniref:LRR receptor-like serine/threonine-protein kinase EFR n=1 Tax=Telopea speciosissima TaxID=54955 RepID=UPI001CC726AB|nr:LRR receptor-like serine/threonine-protein kinase EFR [Telopea speciosissima]